MYEGLSNPTNPPPIAVLPPFPRVYRRPLPDGADLHLSFLQRL